MVRILKNTYPRDDKGVYREVYCPHCKRKYMDKVYYDLIDDEGFEYDMTSCTTCGTSMYAKKGVLEGVSYEIKDKLKYKWPNVGYILR